MAKTIVKFKKTGAEIKQAVGLRIEALQASLDIRNKALSEVLLDSAKVRSFIVRTAAGGGRHEYTPAHEGGETAVVPPDHISSEEIEEIQQMCRRIYQLEKKIYTLSLFASHIDEEEVMGLTFDDLIEYGFKPIEKP